MVINSDCIGKCSCKPNYHTITTTAAPTDLICVIYIKYNFHLGLSEECGDGEGGCDWEEVREVHHNDEDAVSRMNTQLLLKKKVQANTCAYI